MRGEGEVGFIGRKQGDIYFGLFSMSALVHTAGSVKFDKYFCCFMFLWFYFTLYGHVFLGRQKYVIMKSPLLYGGIVFLSEI